MNHKSLYKIGSINQKGQIYYQNKRKANYTIQQVISIKNEMSDDMTNMDVRIMVNEMKMPRDVVGRIMHNLEHGIFDKWIKQWKEINTPKLIPKRSLPVQNNPEKRKELGYGGIP